MPFWKPKKKKKTVHKTKSAKPLPKYEPKPLIPPEIPKIDISAKQQKEPQKPAPKKVSPPRGLEGLRSDDGLRVFKCCR